MTIATPACVLQAAIAAIQHTSTARVIAIRQEAGRWVAQANQDAEDAKAAQVKAEAELEEWKKQMGEKIRNAVLKTSAHERERGAQALAAERGASKHI